MAQVINTNVSSLGAQRQLYKSGLAQQTAMERLSSGLRINSAKDDAAGLAIADRMSSQIRGLNQAVRNANDGISVAQTAEGALGEITSTLQRMRELSVQAANDSNSAVDRSSIQKEISLLQQEVTRVATQTQFNGKSLLDGSFTSQKFQIGAYADQTLSFSIGNSKATNIGSNTVTANGTLNQAQTAASTAPPNPVAAQTLTVTGNIGTTPISVAVNSSAATIAGQINGATASTGVTATAISKAQISSVHTGTITFNLTGAGGTAVAVSAQVANASDLTTLADAINAKAATTGVTAELSGSKDKITLTSTAGDDIVIDTARDGTDGHTVMTVQGMDAGGTLTGSSTNLIDATTTAGNADSTRVGGTLTFSSSGSFSVTASVATGIFTATTANASTLTSVSAINVGTQSGANSALSVLDGALSFVDDMRASLGAVQNRFTSAISALQTTSENVSAARSRIQDADFASETSELSRTQILQQAGTAMLAQANASTQNVLSLLRG